MGGGPAWLVFLVCAFVAEVIGTMAGFGAATILTPIAALFMDVKTAIAVVACFHLFGNASRLVFFGRSLHWKIWLLFGVTGILFSLVGASVTTRLSSAGVKLLFGFFLLCYVGFSHLASERVRLPAALRWAQAGLPSHPATLVGGGIVSGFIAGLIGTGGAIRSACLLAFGLPRDAYIGTSAAIALVVDATRLPVYLANGLIPMAMWPALASLIAAAFAGSWLGQRLVRRVAPATFRLVVMVLLALMGLKLLIDGWHGWA